MLSIPLRLMLRPFSGYRALAETIDDNEFVRGLLRWTFVVGAFVTITATGRLSLFELAFAMASFAWLPLACAVGVFVALRLAPPKRISFRKAYGLYLDGMGPWMIVFLILTGLCLFAPSPAQPIFAAFPWLLLAGTVWGILLTFAMFRAALDFSRARAIGATFLFYLAMESVVIGYYIAMGQFWPIL